MTSALDFCHFVKVTLAFVWQLCYNGHMKNIFKTFAALSLSKKKLNFSLAKSDGAIYGIVSSQRY